MFPEFRKVFCHRLFSFYYFYFSKVNLVKTFVEVLHNLSENSLKISGIYIWCTGQKEALLKVLRRGSPHKYGKQMKNKDDKINKGEHRSKKAAPTTFNNRKQLKGWAKIPIPKQIEDEEHDMKQT